MENDVRFIEKCNHFLRKEWENIPEFVFPDLETNRSLLLIISTILDSDIKTYHYVLPTQLLAKCVDSNLDFRSLQAVYDSKGAIIGKRKHWSLLDQI